MSNTITQTVLEERLQPAQQTQTKFHFTHGKTLLRSSSFYKLREFPAYLCRKGSSDVIHWLLSSSTNLSCLIASHHKQVRRFLLTISVYLVVLVLLLEVGVLCLALAGAPHPSRLFFLIGCVGAMAFLATILARPHINRGLHGKVKKN